MLTQVFHDRILLRFIAASDVMRCDFLQRLQDERSYPDTNISGSDVHESEASQDFEAMNVQLKSLKVY